jgi:hypothetical protein
LSTCFNVTNGFIPFRLPLVDALSISFPGGMRVFLFLGETDLGDRSPTPTQQRDENSKRKACKKKKNLSAIPH